MSERPAPARAHSLCGTARRLNRKKAHAGKKMLGRKPCRYAAIWTCQGLGDRARRLAEPAHGL